jgi:hypothetical protein
MRPKVAIMQGETVGDSNAAQIVASMTGGGYNSVMLDGRIVDDDDIDGVPSFGFGGHVRLGDMYEEYYEYDDYIQYGHWTNWETR